MNIRTAPYLLLTALVLAWPRVALTATQEEAAFLTEVNAIVEPYLAADWFSGTIAIYKDDEIVYEKIFGYADTQRNIKNTAETRIRIGSINKTYTAAIVLRLIQRQVFGLDDTLAEFQLGFPEDTAAKVTVRHLLSHRSGFEDIFNQEYYDTYQSLKTIDDKLPLVIDKPLKFEPGTDRSYSNYNYIVLGAIVEKMTGKSFGEALQDEVLGPIGVTDTIYDLTERVENKALSYQFTPSGKKADRTDRLENLTPDGGMYASAGDLVRFFAALYYSDIIINDSMKTLMMSGYGQTERTWSQVLDDPEAGYRSYGGGPGVSAAVELLLKDRLFVVVLANTDGLVAEEISQRINTAYGGDRPPEARLPAAFHAYQYLRLNGDAAFLEEIGNFLEETGYENFTDRPLNSLGFDLYRNGESGQAITVLKANNAMFPESPNTYDSLAYLYAETGQDELAIEYYKKALEIDPSFDSALEGLRGLGAGK